MGVTKGALFKHFLPKEAILEAVMSWVAERLLARVDQAAQSCTSPLAALEAMFRRTLTSWQSTQACLACCLASCSARATPCPRKMVQTLIREYRGRLQQQLEQGKSTGKSTSAWMPLRQRCAFIGSIQGLVMQSLIAGDVARLRADAPGVWAIYRRGIGGAP